MVARVGDDLFGPATLKNFESFGIDSAQVQMVKGVSSGVAPIFVEESGQNRIIVVKGANDRLLPEDVTSAVLQDARCVILQLEIPLTTVYHTIRLAKANGSLCILNPAPGQPLDLEQVRLADYLIPNESEAEAITGTPVRSPEEAKECAAGLLRRGVPRVIITLGEKGALLATPEKTELVPSFSVKAKDTTGAGDAFIGSFTVFLAEGLPEREAVRRANLYAALSVTKVGTQKSFPTRAEFEAEWKARERADVRTA